MINLWLCFLICIIEGVLFSALFIFVTVKYHRFRILSMMLFIIILTASVYFLYRNSETVWYFFVHPYISLLIVDLADLYFCRHDRFEKLILWPFFILPAVSGFVLTCGWILKIRAISELISSF
ncbi:MAG: hypothetical protein K6F86_12205 [Lachnospiraceae bacterium]|nr:hypothetical protein [Lachnospiraceae bacterium]